MLQIHLIEDSRAWEELRAPWNALLDPMDPYAIFLSHEWLSAWFDAYGQGQRRHVLIAQEGHDLLGVLPLQAAKVMRGWLPVRQLQLMANGHSPCADLICRREDADSVRRAFARHLQREARHWDLVVLPEVMSTANLARLHYPDRARCTQIARHSPYIPLDGTWDEYRTCISKRFLKVLRNNQNRVEREWTAEIEKLERIPDLEAGIVDLFDIGERSWQGQAGTAVGSTPSNRQFYDDITRRFGERGQVRLWFLKLNGQRVAFELHLVHAGVEFGLKTGFDRQFEKSGIGTYLDQHIVRELFAENGLREYDLLGNADFYKQRWTQHTREFRRVSLYGGTWCARLLTLWDLQLVPILKQQDWVQELRQVLQMRATTARQESS